MKKILWLLVSLLMIGSSTFAEEMNQDIREVIKKQPIQEKVPTPFQAISSDKAIILQKGEAKMFCPKCGMTLPMFYKTNHVAHVEGKIEQFCSIHCLADRMSDGVKVTKIQVVDNRTLKFIDVLNAWYVMGSSKAGTMSMSSKYAFGKKSDAQNFAKEFDGKVMTYYAVLDAVKNRLEEEKNMIKIKEAMIAQNGEILYENFCIPFDTTFNTIVEAKTYLITQNPCAKLNEKQLQAIAIYLNLRN